MKKIERIKLNEVNHNELTHGDLKRIKAGANCVDYNCYCHGTTFTSATTDAVLDDDSRR